MKRASIVALVIVLLSGCARDIVRSGNIIRSREDNKTRYDYMLAEALRQKYTGDINQAASIFQGLITIDPERAVPYYELAQIYANAGLGDKAINMAVRASERDPKNYWYQLACGTFYASFGSKDSAAVYFSNALKIDDRSTEIKGILAGLYAENGQAEKADSLLTIIDADSVVVDNMELMIISGLVKKGDFARAANRAEILIGKRPSEPRYKVLLADIYREEGNQAQSDSLYNEILVSDPENIDSRIFYVINSIGKHDYKSAEGYIKSILESDMVGREQKVALAGALLEDTAYVKENSNELELYLETLEEKYPSDEEIMSLRPGMYEIAGREKDAERRYEELISSGMSNFFFKEKLILVYAGEREYEKLLNLAATYSSENNMSLLGKVYYAIAATELGKYDVADRELKKALILSGNNNEVKAQVYSMLGDLKYRERNYDSAFVYLDKALEISPEDVSVLNNYAYYLAEENRDLKRAAKMAEIVMQKAGDNATYIDTYAWVLYKTGKYREAYIQMERVFTIEPDQDAEVLEHMGYILSRLRRCKEALDYFRRALEKDPERKYLIEEINKCL